MTHPQLGRATPVHLAMVDLAGWGERPGAPPWSDEPEDWGYLTGEDALPLILRGRVDLLLICGLDFEFSLLDWRNYLHEAALKPDADDFGYGHPYAAAGVDHIVEAGIARPGRRALEDLAHQAWDEHVESLSTELQERLTRPRPPSA
ncbi:MAG: hypothetical protein AAFQ65_14110 [Myxococcota bacterium]